MKNLFNLLFLLLLSLSAVSQTDALSYQAVIIDNNPQEIPGADVTGNYLSEGAVTLLFTIYDSDGDIEYEEYQQTITDKFGMVNLIIGQGVVTPVSGGLFDEISWDGTPKQLAVGLSFEAFEFEELSREELLFIPYAYHRNITATGTLDVDGVSTLNSELIVENQSLTTLTGDLIVDGNTTLNQNLVVELSTTINENLTVDGDSYFNTITVENESFLNGELIVGGESTFNNTVTVAGGNETNLTGDLNIDGVTNANNTFNVNGGNPSNLSGNLTVEGTTNLNGALNVNNSSPTNLTGTLDVDGETTLEDDLTVNSTSDLNGQVTINAPNLAGGQSSYGAYPLRVEGSNQGVAIKVNGGRTESKNYLTFYDGFGNIHGAVEGQTLGEVQNSFRFIWDVTMGGLELAFIAAEGVACSAQLDFGEAGVMVANAALLGAQWVELTANYELNAGVNFRSGGADYAEWLERMNVYDDFHPGEVVGVFAGKISRTTVGADHVLAISTNPIVLGNSVSENMDAKAEKVAFLGQVPVRCVGVVHKGDYILPSGQNDGLAVAFNPSDLPTNRFNEIIGVAWEEGSTESTNLINVAIGLTSNDLASRVEKVESELEQLKREMAELKAHLTGEPIPGNQQITAVLNETAEGIGNSISKGKRASNMTPTEFDNWLADYGHIFEEQMSELKQLFSTNNVGYQNYPEIAKIVDSPLVALREMYEGKFLGSLWTSLEQQHIKKD